ncbi:MAG: DUF3786 domain-containing protein [Desulfobulbaceae bacterium]|nr:DUF3786 domain-containing protein [Desulfobulbaceae bacterium]
MAGPSRQDEPAVFGITLNPLEFIRYTARTNCGECGHPTCLAFSVAVTIGGADPSKCPYLEPAGLACGGSREPDAGMEQVERGQEERDMALVAHLKTKVQDISFADIAPRLGARWSAEQPDLIRFRYLGRMVEFSKDGMRMDGDVLVDPRDQILLYNYVALGGSEPPSGEWLGMESLPNSISKVRTLSAYCEQPLARRFAGRCTVLAGICRQVGGEPARGDSSADLAFIVPVLPHLPHYLLFWDQDPEEGFESRVKVLFDRHVLEYLDIESLVFTAERMAEHLLELDT